MKTSADAQKLLDWTAERVLSSGFCASGVLHEPERRISRAAGLCRDCGRKLLRAEDLAGENRRYVVRLNYSPAWHPFVLSAVFQPGCYPRP